MSLREIVENHLSVKELNRIDLFEINFSYGLEFYNPETNISNVLLSSWESSLKPRANEIVKIMSENDIIRTLKHAHNKSYSIYKSAADSFFIVIEFSW